MHDAPCVTKDRKTGTQAGWALQVLLVVDITAQAGPRRDVNLPGIRGAVMAQ
ncbi:hypothetical protein [Streptomyces sp. NPDC046821]|uniref:hypothetical protein n=1 Tax=Streptomyces sp. NPDC046821 TaxID=3154702 RepID=UPI0033EAE6E7